MSRALPVEEGAALARGGTYLLRNPQTRQVMRTGRTCNLACRERQHGRDPALEDYEFEIVHRTDVYAQQRGLEQMLHDMYRPPLNYVRPISPINPNRPSYMQAAEDYLRVDQ